MLELQDTSTEQLMP